MELDGRTRRTGALGVTAGILWIVNGAGNALLADSAVEGSGTWYAGQVVATAALLVTGLAVLGLGRLRAGGPGRLAGAVLVAWAVGWFLLALAGVGLLVTGTFDSPTSLLFPIGGNLAALAGIVGGILIARSGVLARPARWLLLGWSLWFGVVVSVVMAVAEQSWTAPASELVSYLLLLGGGVALLASGALRPVPGVGARQG